MTKPFVDRVEEMKCLREALQYDEQEIPVLVFTGIGGMGKTALRSAFEKYVLKPKKVPYAVLDYDGDPNLRPMEATLRTIRRQLGRHKVKTPVFDFLYARYFELSTGFKISSKNCPPELEGVATILDGIPTVGNISQILLGLAQLGLRVKKRVRHKEWLHRIRELEPKEVLNLLPEVLAEDLEETMSSRTPKILKTSGFRIALLLDAYEHLSESQLDDTLHRKLLLLTPHLLRVIFTRDPLPWEHKFPMKWRDKIEHFSSLGDLCRKDAKVFLQRKSVDDPDLQEYLYHLTNGYPFHLELCADICREIEETTHREPGIQDFEGAAQAKDLTEELVNRLLRQLKDDSRDLMCLAAYPRWVTKEILEVLSSVPESVPRIFKKFIKLSMFSSHPEISKSYILRKEVRDCLLLQQRRKRLWKTLHERLSTFHRERWRETQSFQHIREALYHMFYENPEEAMKLFEKYFWKLLEKFSFGEAEGLLEAVPIETLSEESKRKADFARARLLTSMAHSQQSLITAKNIYKSLIAAERDEKALNQYLFYLGELLRMVADYDKALDCLQKSLSIRLKVCGERHVDTADAHQSIGFVYVEKEEYTKALEHFQRSLAVRLKLQGEQHPNVAKTYINIGRISSYLGKYENALKYFQKSLAIWMKVYGEEHPDIAAVYNNIGHLNNLQGKYEKALQYYQKVVAILHKIYGEEHLSLAPTYINTGIVYSELADYQNALKYCRKALDIWSKIYGERHPYIATSYNSIGNIYQLQHENGKALDYYKKALTIALKIYGEEHTVVAHSYGNIGNVYSEEVEYKKALQYYNKAFAILVKVCGAEHPDVARTYGNIGIINRKLGEYEKALKCYSEELVILQKVFASEHPDIANTYNEIAQTLRALKKDEEAIEKIRQSIEIYRKFKLWKEVVEGLEMLAGWLGEIGEKKEAEDARKEAERIKREKINKSSKGLGIQNEDKYNQNRHI